MTAGQAGILGRLLRASMAVLTLPPAILHELTHAAAAAPIAERVAIVMEPAGFAGECRVWYRDAVPQWAVVAAHLSPHMLGLLFAGLVGWQFIEGGLRFPVDLEGWLVWCVVGAWWAIYTMPSPQDRNPTGGGGEDA